MHFPNWCTQRMEERRLKVLQFMHWLGAAGHSYLCHWQNACAHKTRITKIRDFRPKNSDNIEQLVYLQCAKL